MSSYSCLTFTCKEQLTFPRNQDIFDLNTGMPREAIITPYKTEEIENCSRSNG